MGGDIPMGHARAQQASAKARLRQKAQLTLPEEIRRALRVREGDEVEFSVLADGTITVRGYVSIPADQLWRYAPDYDGRQADDEGAAAEGAGR
jgi:AbrB family looped-hinge helix DNA binding protein